MLDENNNDRNNQADQTTEVPPSFTQGNAEDPMAPRQPDPAGSQTNQPHTPPNSSSPNTGYYAYTGQQLHEKQTPPQEPSSGYQYQNGQWGYGQQPNPPQQPPQPPQKAPKHHGNGAKLLAIIMSAAFVVVSVLFVGYVLLDRRTMETNRSEEASSSQESQASSFGDAQLQVQDVPNETPENVKPSGALTNVEIAKKVRPSVVGIVAYESQQYVGEGSGIIISKDGYILTNSHVVFDGSLSGGIKVILSNDEECEAQLIGFDVRTDLAVIKIQKDNLVAAEFGNSDQVEVGESVIAIGSPNGIQYAGSVTGGMISAVDRVINIGNQDYMMPCLQTDAAINQGNSGGALVNQYGQVIGINSAKLMIEGVEGMGFAIPSNVAKPVVDNLIENGYVKGRPRIGITFTQINPALAELNGIPAGLRVVSVDTTCDVYKKGIQAGDIIFAMNGKEVHELNDVVTILNTKTPGDEVELSVYRVDEDGRAKQTKVNVILAEDTSGAKNTAPKTENGLQ